jgi:hypothetical protein
MPTSSSTLRGVKDIRTRSGAPDQTIVPYRAYMAITALEMEKARRQTERQSLVARLKNVVTRLRIIDSEKTVLLDRLNKSATRAAAAPRSAHRQTTKARPTRGFKHQY